MRLTSQSSTDSAPLDLTNAPISLQCVALIVRILERDHIAAADVLQGTGIDEAMLKLPSGQIRRQQELQVFSNALRLTGDSTLGLRVGSEMRLQSYGILAFAMMLSPTLLDAIKAAFQFNMLMGNYLGLELIEEGDTAVLTAGHYVYPKKLEVFNTDLCLASTWRMVHDSLGQQGALEGVHVRAPRAMYADTYRAIFGCDVVFGAATNALRFPRNLLQEPLPFAEPVSWHLAYQQCIAVETEWRLAAGDDVVAQALRLLRGDPKTFRHLPRMAAALHMSERSFRRHLQGRGTRFQLLADQAIMARARDFLASTTLTIEEISERLGYADPSGFRQAFRRLTGQSPIRFRKEDSSR